MKGDRLFACEGVTVCEGEGVRGGEGEHGSGVEAESRPVQFPAVDRVKEHFEFTIRDRFLIQCSTTNRPDSQEVPFAPDSQCSGTHQLATTLTL